MLRNIGYTGPYMHDGSIVTLEDVIDFKMSGGFPHPNKSDKINSFSLNTQQKNALIAFLNSLNDTNFIAREVARRNRLE